MSDIVTKINSLNSSLAKINNERTKAIANKEAFSVNVVASLKKLKASTGVDLLADFEAGNTEKVGTALRELYGKEEKALSDKVALATKLIEAFESGDYVKMNTLLGIEVHEPSLREQSGIDKRVAEESAEAQAPVVEESAPVVEESAPVVEDTIDDDDFFATSSEPASVDDDDFFAPETKPAQVVEDTTDDVFDPATIAEDASPVEDESSSAADIDDYDYDFDF